MRCYAHCPRNDSSATTCLYNVRKRSRLGFEATQMHVWPSCSLPTAFGSLRGVVQDAKPSRFMFWLSCSLPTARQVRHFNHSRRQELPCLQVRSRLSSCTFAYGGTDSRLCTGARHSSWRSLICFGPSHHIWCMADDQSHLYD